MGAEKVQFYPLDITYKVEDNKAKIYLFGRTLDNKQICIIDDQFQPYFFVLLKDVAVEIGKYDLEKGIKWDDYY